MARCIGASRRPCYKPKRIQQVKGWRAVSGQTESYIVVLCTCPDDETARELATEIVKARLAACVNIVPTVRSIYRWQGEVASDEEALLLIKSTASRYGELESAIALHHPYDVPEIVQVPITAGVPSYLAWVQEMVKAQ